NSARTYSDSRSDTPARHRIDRSRSARGRRAPCWQVPPPAPAPRKRRRTTRRWPSARSAYTVRRAANPIAARAASITIPAQTRPFNGGIFRRERPEARRPPRDRSTLRVLDLIAPVVPDHPFHVVARLAIRDALDELIGVERAEARLPFGHGGLAAVVRRERFDRIAAVGLHELVQVGDAERDVGVGVIQPARGRRLPGSLRDLLGSAGQELHEPARVGG